jgi:hypothetical protein
LGWALPASGSYAYLDVQVFSFLHPYDLLRLSRTTKTLRGLLMARSARSTWIQALAAVPDLPPRPEDLSEYAWTRLLFDGVCHVSLVVDSYFGSIAQYELVL